MADEELTVEEKAAILKAANELEIPGGPWAKFEDIPASVLEELADEYVIDDEEDTDDDDE